MLLAMTPIPRLKAHAGPAILSYGFRPFFLLAAMYAATVILIWLPLFYGVISFTTVFSPRDWHVHELLFGYFPAVITGFLLTAIPNWTGRLPLQGRPLLILVLAWLAGRLAIALSLFLGPVLAGVVDCAFLLLVSAATGREIVTGQNWRNLKVLLPLSLLTAANAAFHVEAHVFGSADVSVRVGQAAIILLIMIIGGRIIPSFTRNWLARDNPGRLPSSFDNFDVVAIVLSAAALVLWAAWPNGRLTATVLAVASVLQLSRLARWAGDRTARNWLVLILHLAYLFVPIGFLLAALAAIDLVASTASAHAWMMGAAGTMTIAVMTRATLGHTGRALSASPTTIGIYGAALSAALARILAALFPDWSILFLDLAALAWIAAFAGFCLVYGPMLLRPKLSSGPGG